MFVFHSLNKFKIRHNRDGKFILLLNKILRFNIPTQIPNQDVGIRYTQMIALRPELAIQHVLDMLMHLRLTQRPPMSGCRRPSWR